MPKNIVHKILESHLADGKLRVGEPIQARVDQAYLTDATGPLAVLVLEGLAVERARTEAAAIYADRLIGEEDPREGDDHRLLRSAAQRFGLWWSRPGNGVGAALHLLRLSRPGRLLLGADPYVHGVGAIGCLALAGGGLDVARAIAGEPFALRVPPVLGVRLSGALGPWVSGFDLGLELLRRLGSTGADGCVVEFHGPALAHLGVPDRQQIATMCAAIGAIGAVFPSDDRARAWLRAEGRPDDWSPMVPEPRAAYDLQQEVDLGQLQPMVALPPGPGNVATVQEIARVELEQVVIGGPAAAGWRDLAVLARLLTGRQVPGGVSVHVEPATRGLLVDLDAEGLVGAMLRAGARLHEPGAVAVAGLGPAYATGASSLRTAPWHGPGGTAQAGVFLASPQTAAAAALTGRLVDPRTLGLPLPRLDEPRRRPPDPALLEEPLPHGPARQVMLRLGPGQVLPPPPEDVPDAMRLPVLAKLGDGVPTGTILPVGHRAAALRGQPAALAEFSFAGVERGYAQRAREVGEHVVVAGRAYGQHPGDEMAALGPRLLGVRAVIALSFAAAHERDLANWGVLPLRFTRDVDYDLVAPGDVLTFDGLRAALREGRELRARIAGRPDVLVLACELHPRRVEELLHGERARRRKAAVPA